MAFRWYSPRWALLAALALSVSPLSCSDDGSPDAGVDAGVPDGALPADGAPDAVAPDAGPKQVAAPATPKELLPSQWMLGEVTGSSDPVKAALQAGTFGYPKAGKDANNTTWMAVTPSAGGKVAALPAPKSAPYVVWAVAKVTLSAPAHLMIMTAPGYEVWVNGVMRPGDVYGTRKVFVSLPAKAGENLVAVRYYVRRAATAYALLQTTPHELWVNTSDLTPPELPLGSTGAACLGAPVLNLSATPAHTLVASVKGDQNFEATSVTYPGLGPHAVTQVAFSIKPKAAIAKAGEELPVTLRLESPALNYAYEQQVKVKTVAADAAYRLTRVSKTDGSCQYAGVLPPSSFDKSKKYALILSLHGAGVEAINQAKSYAPKDWAYVVAPTNRRPFGFDWEVWGRRDALEALDHAMATFNIDPTRVYLTGHSMGGHGTWHVGVTTPGRFAAIAPSAGWCSFYTYGGSTKPSGAFARTQAHSDTPVYLGNLKRRGVYILHGGADTNVPPSEGQNMYKLVQAVTSDVKYHEEPGMGHWWDKDKSTPGTDCVDYKPMMDFFKARTLDPFELDFDFLTPGPWYSDTHSYVKILSQSDLTKDARVVSAKSGTAVTLSTTNVRGMTLDGAALKKKGVTSLTVDGTAVTLADGPIAWGTQTGKTPGSYGPFNEVMYRPFCLVYDDSASAEAAFREYAAYVASEWAVIGNGHACVIPLSRLSAGPPAGYNLIYLGVPPAQISGGSLTGSWDASQVTVAGKSYQNVALYLAFPGKSSLSAAVTAHKGSEKLLFGIPLFTSRVVLPDYFVYSSAGTKAAGLFSAEWK